MDALIAWLVDTRLSLLMTGPRWSWPIAETLHFCGLTLLAGTVGLFDLRLLGIVKGIAPRVLHEKLVWGFVGFGVLFLTGIGFVAGTPDQYFFNRAFQVKVVLLTLMGLNAAAFYKFEFAGVRDLGPYDAAPTRAKAIAAFSLLLLAATMCAGRMLTFFRPPY